ncbi:hypothetical protein EJ774_21230 [Pandoraea apista]|jgi:hypothetical protein|uniref:Transposase n=1 Tax=Pandoraea apista TaxID=93218 RepID=A0ABX9ZLF4_9BURK|nr:hypothetical protein [Pandoraea apista]RSK77879.1 hypothetical protein EJE83_17995 [Pandoraea apista]RUN81866.1 hypothetical protein EJ774_21230 [Pandoraea apista]
MTDLNELWEQKKREVERQLPRDVREAKRKSRFERINGKLRMKTANPRRRIKKRLIEAASLEHLRETIDMRMGFFIKERMEQK